MVFGWMEDQRMSSYMRKRVFEAPLAQLVLVSEIQSGTPLYLARTAFFIGGCMAKGNYKVGDKVKTPRGDGWVCGRVGLDVLVSIRGLIDPATAKQMIMRFPAKVLRTI